MSKPSYESSTRHGSLLWLIMFGLSGLTVSGVTWLSTMFGLGWCCSWVCWNCCCWLRMFPFGWRLCCCCCCCDCWMACSFCCFSCSAFFFCFRTARMSGVQRLIWKMIEPPVAGCLMRIASGQALSSRMYSLIWAPYFSRSSRLGVTTLIN